MRFRPFRVLLLAALTTSAVPVSGAGAQATTPDAQVEALLQSMTLEQRVGQLFMVSLYGEELSDTGLTFLRTMMPGAVALFSYNGSSPQVFTQTVNAWQTVAGQVGAKLPLLVAVDQEGGTVTRLTDGFTAMPWGGALGAMPTDDARTVGKLSGQELTAVGINTNLAPVVDVRTAPNAFMEPRMFGSDAEAVGSSAAAYLQGLADSGVIGVLKHFPGHGSAGDSHTELPIVNYDKEHIDSVELVPFKAGIDAGAEIVMVGHLVYPALDPTPGLPASLSPTIIGEVLRKQLNFNGVVMSDAMDMAAIVDHFTQPVAAVMAVKAGIDIIASGPHTPIAQQLAMRQAIIDAVNNGTLPASQVEEAVRRILTLKAKHGLLQWMPLDPASASARVNTVEHQPIVDDIYLRTVTIAQDPNKLLPLSAGSRKVALIYPGAYPSIQRYCALFDRPSASLAYNLGPNTEQIASAHSISVGADLVIIFTYNMSDYPGQVALVNNVPPEKAIVVALQSPYDLEQGIHPAAYMASFNAEPGALKADCAVLYGQQAAQGKWQTAATPLTP